MAGNHDDVLGDGLCAGGNGLIDRLHAHVREFEHGLVVGNLERVESVGVGHGAHTALADAHRHADERIALVVFHDTFHGALAVVTLQWRDGDDAVVLFALAANLAHHLVHYLPGWGIGFVDSHPGQAFQFVGIVEKLDFGLPFHLVEELLHRHVFHVDRDAGVVESLCRQANGHHQESHESQTSFQNCFSHLSLCFLVNK